MANNPTKQNRIADLVEHFNKFGYTMFPQQRSIYTQISERISRQSVMEVGCGVGQGTAVLQRWCKAIVGTDSLPINVEFAKQMYPWINFRVWDISRSYGRQKKLFDTTVCIETLEHVADPVVAVHNIIEITTKRLWISTPNGNGKPETPDNPYHVREYTPKKMLEIIQSCTNEKHQVIMRHWKTFEPITTTDTSVDPLVYEVELRI